MKEEPGSDAPVTFSGEVDRIYVAAPDTIQVCSPSVHEPWVAMQVGCRHPARPLLGGTLWGLRAWYATGLLVYTSKEAAAHACMGDPTCTFQTYNSWQVS